MTSVGKALSDNAIDFGEAKDLRNLAKKRAKDTGTETKTALTSLLNEYQTAQGQPVMDATLTADAILVLADHGKRGDSIGLVKPAIPAVAVPLTEAIATNPIDARLQATHADFVAATQKLVSASQELATAAPDIQAEATEVTRTLEASLEAGVEATQGKTDKDTQETNKTQSALDLSNSLTEFGRASTGARKQTTDGQMQAPTGTEWSPQVTAYQAALIDYVAAVRQYAEALSIKSTDCLGEQLHYLQSKGIVQATDDGLFTSQQVMERINTEVALLTTIAEKQGETTKLLQDVTKLAVAGSQARLSDGKTSASSATSPVSPLPSTPTSSGKSDKSSGKDQAKETD